MRFAMRVIGSIGFTFAFIGLFGLGCFADTGTGLVPSIILLAIGSLLLWSFWRYEKNHYFSD